jgi:hypothetical protein
MPVAVEKLACEKSAEIKMRQEALQMIFFNDLDIFYPRISTYLGKKGVFQQSRLLPTVILPVADFQVTNIHREVNSQRLAVETVRRGLG